MGTRTKIFIAALPILVLAGWVALRGGSPGANDLAERGADRAGSVGSESGEAALSGVALGDERRAPDGPEITATTEAASWPIAPPSTPPSTTEARWWLELELVGPTSAEAVRVSVRARADGTPFAGQATVTATAESGERAWIALDGLLAEGKALSALVLAVEHPSLWAADQLVELPGGTGAAEGPLETARARVQLSATQRIVGQVVLAGGGGVAADVGAWRMGSGGPETVVAARTRSADDGSFHLIVPGSGAYLVVAAHVAHLPAWRQVGLTGGDPPFDVGLLELGLGAELSGTFMLGGRPPTKRVSFSLDRAIGQHVLNWDEWGFVQGTGLLAWRDGAVERVSSSQVAGDEGTFRLTGLTPGAWTMNLHGFDEGHARFERRPRDVTAPGEGLCIELDWSRVAILLKPDDPSNVPAEAALVLERPDRDPERMQLMESEIAGQQEREFVFHGGEALSFRLEIEGAEPVLRELAAPPAGERVELNFPVVRVDRSASLTLDLVGALPPDGTPYTVHVAPADASLRAGRAVDRYPSVSVVQQGRRLHLAGLTPGAVRLLVYPGQWAGQRATYHVDAEVDVELRGEQESYAAITLALGGRLEVGRRSPSGGWLQEPCSITAASGEAVDAIFVAYAPDGGGGASARGVLPDLAPCVVVPNLEPGTYTVRVGSEARTATLVAGETTRVIIE